MGLCSMENNQKNSFEKQFFCNSINSRNELACVDYIDFDKKIISYRTNKVTLSGEEEWYYDNLTKTYYYHQCNKFCDIIGGKSDKMLCTHFRWVEYTDSPEHDEFQGGPENQIMFNFDYGKDGVENFKSWLKMQSEKGTPVEVLYTLQYPIIIQEDSQSIPDIEVPMGSTVTTESNGIKADVSVRFRKTGKKPY